VVVAGIAENLIEDRTGKQWTADEYAIERGYLYVAIEFAGLLTNVFNVRGYDRMQELWQLRDRALAFYRKSPRGFPEGSDINDYL
jgi:hypothetical protein